MRGDACTKFFHLQACHRRRTNSIFAINHEGQCFTEEEAKSGIVYQYYNGLLGTPFSRMHRIDMAWLHLPRPNLDCLVVPFTPDEVASVVRDSPFDRAPGPDGFSAAFYKAAWPIIADDVFRVFQALWELDFRSFHEVNSAMMILIQKKEVPEGLKDYRSISLIHSVGKLFAKGLAMRLAPMMEALVMPNQTAFIRGRSIHDNFRSVQLTCRYLHAKRFPALLLKIDLGKVFDTVAWPFLLEVLQQMGFSA